MGYGGANAGGSARKAGKKVAKKAMPPIRQSKKPKRPKGGSK